MLRAVAYARYGELSIEEQLDNIRVYAQDHKYAIIEEISDNSDDPLFDRPGARRILENPNCDIVLVYTLSSWATTREEVEKSINNFLKPHNVELHVVRWRRSVQEEDSRLVALYASSESVTEKIKRGLHGSIAPGRSIYGYNKIGTRKRARLEINDEEAAVVRRIFQMHNQGLGAATIAQRLNDEGIPSPSTKKKAWRQAQWRNETVRRILRDTRYTGVFPLFRSKDRVQVPVNRPDLTIITTDIFEKSQQKIDSNVDKHRFTTVHEYLMAGGRFTCDCGYSISTQTQTRKTRSGSKTYSYYRCSSKAHNRESSCKVPLLNVQKVDDLIWEFVERTLRSTTETLFQLRQIRETQAMKRIADEQARRRAQIRIAEIETELERDYFDFRKQLMPEHTYVRRKQELEAELQQLKTQETIKPALETVPTDNDLNDQMRTISDLLDELSPLSFDEKQRVIEGIDVKGRLELLDTDTIRIHVSIYGAELGYVDYIR